MNTTNQQKPAPSPAALGLKWPWTITREADGSLRFELRCGSCCAADFPSRGARLLTHARIYDGKPGFNVDGLAADWKRVGDRPACSQDCASSLEHLNDPHCRDAHEIEREAHARGQHPQTMGVPGHVPGERSVVRQCLQCSTVLRVHQRKNVDDSWGPDAEAAFAAQGWRGAFCSLTCETNHARTAPEPRKPVVPVLESATLRADAATAEYHRRKAAPKLENREVSDPKRKTVAR